MDLKPKGWKQDVTEEGRLLVERKARELWDLCKEQGVELFCVVGITTVDNVIFGSVDGRSDLIRLMSKALREAERRGGQVVVQEGWRDTDDGLKIAGGEA